MTRLVCRVWSDVMACCSLSIYSKSNKNLHLSVGKANMSDAVMMTHDRSMYLTIVKADCVAQAPKG